MKGGKRKKRKHVSNAVSVADDKANGAKPRDLTTRGEATSVSVCHEKYVPMFGNKQKQADTYTPNKKRIKLDGKTPHGWNKEMEVLSQQIAITEHTTESKENDSSKKDTDICEENKTGDESKALDKDGDDEIKEDYIRNHILNRDLVDQLNEKEADLEGENVCPKETANLENNESRINQRRPEELDQDDLKMEAVTGVLVSKLHMTDGRNDHLFTDDNRDDHKILDCPSKENLNQPKQNPNLNDGIPNKDCSSDEEKPSENRGDDICKHTAANEICIRVTGELQKEENSRNMNLVEDKFRGNRAMEGSSDIQDHGIRTQSQMPALDLSDKINNEQMKADCLINASVPQIEGVLAGENLPIPEVQQKDCVERMSVANIDVGQNNQKATGDCEREKLCTDDENKVHESEVGESEDKEVTTVSDQPITETMADGLNVGVTDEATKDDPGNLKLDRVKESSQSLRCNDDSNDETEAGSNVLLEAEKKVEVLNDWMEDRQDIQRGNNFLRIDDNGMLQADKSLGSNNLSVTDQSGTKVLLVNCGETQQSVVKDDVKKSTDGGCQRTNEPDSDYGLKSLINVGLETKQAQRIYLKGACSENTGLELGRSSNKLANDSTLDAGDTGMTGDECGKNVTESENYKVINAQNEEGVLEIRKVQASRVGKDMVVTDNITIEEITCNCTKEDKDEKEGVRDANELHNEQLVFVTEQVSDSVMSNREQEVIRECLSELSAVNELEDWTDSQLIQLDEQLMENRTNDKNVACSFSSKSNPQKQLQCKRNKQMFDEKRNEGTSLMKSLIRDIEGLNEMIIQLRRQVSKYRENLI